MYSVIIRSQGIKHVYYTTGTSLWHGHIGLGIMCAMLFLPVKFDRNSDGQGTASSGQKLSAS